MSATNIEDSYPLSPMQQGMVFHSRYVPGSGTYIQQLICALNEDLNVYAFKQAWQRVVDRHSVLRTTFRCEGLDEPRQEVHESVEIPWAEQDWRSFMRGEQEDRLAAYLEMDRQKHFESPEQPLIRFALFRLGKAEYRFIWTSHHALLDGRSYMILVKEVFAFYDSSCRNENLLLTQPRPYKDYIGWLNQQDFSKHELFWRPQLRGFVASTPFGIDRPSYAASAEDGTFATEKVKLDHSVTEALMRCGQKYDLTLNTLIQGAWALLLSRYSGQDDVIFGATRAARHTALAGAQDMVGLFINTLPIRVRVYGHMSLESLLTELRTQWIKLRDFEHSPLVSIQGWSDVPPGQPLFESLVVFENYQLNSTLRGQGGNWQNREFDLLGITNYPIVLSGELSEEVILKITYNCGRFENNSISRMLGHLQTLLEGMAADPERTLSDLRLLTKPEEYQLLVEWNDTERDYPKDKCIHELFEAQVENTPDAVGVVFENQQLTYRELNTKANQLAHYLQKFGVGPGVLVGICVERSLEMIVGMLGILKAGGAYVPLDPSYPKERLVFMLQDSGAPILITQRAFVDVFINHSAKIIFLDTDWEKVVQGSESNLAPETSSDSLAYVIYTSGSTGNPKGVVMEHRALCNLVSWQVQSWSGPRSAKTLQFAPLSFDVSFQEIFSTWCSGGTLVLISEELRRDALTLLHFLRDNSVERLFLPFVALQQLAEVAQDRGVVPTGLREIITAGEQLQMTHQLTSLLGELKGCTLSNQYGPTESHVVTAFTLTDLTNKCRTLPPIGRPIANTEIYLLDVHLQPVPIGVPGELYIGGVGLARGYLNRPALTAEKFIANPFASESGSRLYKTGDVARYLPDGNIEFLGRLDHQVKIRGFRIELGEIEAILKNHPAVYECVIVAREEFPNTKRLAAYVVADSDSTPAVDELRRFLKGKLPEFMIPTVFVFIDNLPLTPNGKVDRNALPMPDLNYQRSDDRYVAPRTDVEKKLAGIWAAVLKFDQIGIHDNFFDVGGHSLLAMQVISRIRDTFQIEIPVRQLFEAPNVADLAEVIQKLDSKLDGSALASITRAARDRYRTKLQG